MQCPRCHGKGYIMVTETPPQAWTEFNKLWDKHPCPDCYGWGDMPCCDGEDRWQTDKIDPKDSSPGTK